MIKVTVWDEDLQNSNQEMKKIYPDGIRAVIADRLGMNDDFAVTQVHAQMPDMGINDEIIANTDVLIWWAHRTHDALPDALAEKIRDAVLGGMGFVVLHSAHLSKPFKMLMGTSCTLHYKYPDRAKVFTTCPTHPIASGIPQMFELEPEELYGEFFDIPKPDDVVFTSWFEGGCLFRGGCTWTRGYGKIFYFHAGHDTYPTYHNPYVQKIIENAVYWAAPEQTGVKLECVKVRT